jgi:hypothetical protein
LVFRTAQPTAPALNLIISFLKEPVSRSGLHQKFTDKAAKFFKKLLETIIVKQVSRNKIIEPEILKHFERVMLQDSTSWDVSENLSAIFPGSGGSASSANCKLQCVYDYKSGSIVLVEDREGIEPDQKYSQNIGTIVEKDDLIIFDLGYWSFETFYTIQSKGGYFLSRLNTAANFWYSKGKEIIQLNLEEFLKKQKGNSVEIIGFIKDKQDRRVKVRLTAYRVPANIADQRRWELRKKANKKGHRVSRKSLQLCDWSLFITNASEEQIPGKMIRTIYRVRWNIELLFKSWKSILRIHKSNVKKNENRLKCELYGKLILAVITHIIHSELHSYLWITEQKELSFDKLWKFIVSHSEGLHNAIKRSLRSFSNKVNSYIDVIIKECEKYHQKSRKTTLQMINEYIGDPEPIMIDLSTYSYLA